MQMRDEVFPSVGTQNMVTSCYQVSDLEDIGFHWDDLDSNKDAVVQPSIDTSISPSAFHDIEMGSLAESSILNDEEQDRENSLRHPTTPVSERPNLPLLLISSRSL